MCSTAAIDFHFSLFNWLWSIFQLFVADTVVHDFVPSQFHTASIWWSGWSRDFSDWKISRIFSLKISDKNFPDLAAVISTSGGKDTNLQTCKLQASLNHPPLCRAVKLFISSSCRARQDINSQLWNRVKITACGGKEAVNHEFVGKSRIQCPFLGLFLPWNFSCSYGLKRLTERPIQSYFSRKFRRFRMGTLVLTSIFNTKQKNLNYKIQFRTEIPGPILPIIRYNIQINTFHILLSY